MVQLQFSALALHRLMQLLVRGLTLHLLGTLCMALSRPGVVFRAVNHNVKNGSWRLNLSIKVLVRLSHHRLELCDARDFLRLAHEVTTTLGRVVYAVVLANSGSS